MSKITFRAVIEVLGKPQEHVDQSLKNYVEQLKNDQNYVVKQAKFADIKQQDEAELWATFAELEIQTQKVEHLTSFCFDYMPSIIEIIDPREFHFTEVELSQIINDLQAKLHQVDMVAKQIRMERDLHQGGLGALLNNYILLLLSRQDLTSEQLSKLTGVAQDELEDFLDKLIDQGKIDLKEGIYFLVKKGVSGKKEVKTE